MSIEPKVEEPARDLLGHAIRGEWQDFANVAEDIGEQRLTECLSLCLRIAGYIVIDISGRAWPTAADVREVAQRMATTDLDSGKRRPPARRRASGLAPAHAKKKRALSE
jgi:hypothetical protein